MQSEPITKQKMKIHNNLKSRHNVALIRTDREIR